MGEGGGQVLRKSLSLAMVTGQPATLANIRAGRGKVGLLRQHLTCVRAAAVCGATLEAEIPPRGAGTGGQALDWGGAGAGGEPQHRGGGGWEGVVGEMTSRSAPWSAVPWVVFQGCGGAPVWALSHVREITLQASSVWAAIGNAAVERAVCLLASRWARPGVGGAFLETVG